MAKALQLKFVILDLPEWSKNWKLPRKIKNQVMMIGKKISWFLKQE